MLSQHEDIDEKLIACVRSFPIIYDLKQSFKNRRAKDEAWESIAEVLSRDADECKSRWRTIRDSYRKVNKKGPTGVRIPRRSKYKSDTLRFLDINLGEERRSQPSVKQEDNAEHSYSANKFYNFVPIRPKKNEEAHVNDYCEVLVLHDLEDEDVVGDESILGNHDVTDLGNDQNRLNETRDCDEEPEKKRLKTSDVASTSKDDLLSELRRCHEERTRATENAADKRTSSEEDDHVFTFFRSMAQCVARFPPGIVAETKVRTCQLVAEMEMRALSEGTIAKKKTSVTRVRKK